MGEHRLMSDDEHAQKRALVTAVVWKGGLIATAVAFILFVAPPRSWLPFVGLAVPFVFELTTSAWLLAKKNYAAVGPPGASIRRLRRSNIGFTVIVVALAWFAYSSPIFKLFVSSCSRADYERAMKELHEAPDAGARFHALHRAAMTTVFYGSIDDARRYGSELVAGGDRRVGGRIDGNAIHDGHTVLGLVALREGRVADAKAELLLAGGTVGSPNLDTFGPNVMLAKELLERHEDATVLAYFDLCGRFWDDHDRLARWSADIRAGRVPDFGANLIY